MLGSRRPAALQIDASPYTISVNSSDHPGTSRIKSPRARLSLSFDSRVRSESPRARLRSCFGLLTVLCVEYSRVDSCDEGRT